MASDGIEVGVSDPLKLSRVKDPDTQKRRIENIRRDRKVINCERSADAIGYIFVSSDVASDGIEVGVSDPLKLCRVKDPDTQKRRIENIRRDR